MHGAQTLLSAMGIFVLFSCAEVRVHLPTTEDKLNPSVTRKAKELKLLTVPELLEEKYDKAELSCSLTVAYKDHFVSYDLPADSFTWNLLSQPNDEISFELSGSAGPYSSQASFSFKALTHLVRADVTAPTEGLQYSLRNTPRLEYQVKLETINESRTYRLKTENPKLFIYERVPTMVYNSSLNDEKEAHDFSQKLECILDTVPKEVYEDQYSARPL